MVRSHSQPAVARGLLERGAAVAAVVVVDLVVAAPQPLVGGNRHQQRPAGCAARGAARAARRGRPGRCSITSRHTARSKESSAKGISITEPSTTSPTWRARASSALVGESSTPVTSPWRASSTMLRPLPQPASRMRARGGRPRRVDRPLEHAAAPAVPPVAVLGAVGLQLVIAVHRDASFRKSPPRAVRRTPVCVGCLLSLPRLPAFAGFGCPFSLRWVLAFAGFGCSLSPTLVLAFARLAALLSPPRLPAFAGFGYSLSPTLVLAFARLAALLSPPRLPAFAGFGYSLSPTLVLAFARLAALLSPPRLPAFAGFGYSLSPTLVSALAALAAPFPPPGLLALARPYDGPRVRSGHALTKNLACHKISFMATQEHTRSPAVEDYCKAIFTLEIAWRGAGLHERARRAAGDHAGLGVGDAAQARGARAGHARALPRRAADRAGAGAWRSR